MLPEAVHYTVTIPAPATHLVTVTARFPVAALGDTVDVAMPAWCPGSYLIRDYARFVRGLSVRGDDGESRPAVKQDKHTWRVERRGARSLEVSYQVYGHDLSVRTNHVDPSHAFLHGPATFVHVEALRDRPCRLAVVPPRDGAPAGVPWPIATGLAAAPLSDWPDCPAGAVGFAAVDLDELYDGPLHLGAAEVRRFQAAGAPIELAVWGDVDGGGVCNLDDLVADLPPIMEAQAARFGGTMPFQRYVFILMLSGDAYGGLEHKTSSANLSSNAVFATRKSYEGLLELLSHEFFHAWNGKRMAPPALTRFDYRQEAYTRCLWVVEGLTSYFDRLAVRESGRMTAKAYLEKLLDEWTRLQATPGRREQSLEASSFDAWIKLYKPDESNLNSTVSYYLKGGLVACALDLEIRRRSEGQRRLADVLGLLWRRFGVEGRAYPEDVQRLFEEASGLDLEGFFARHVRGTDDPDLVGELGHLGLELKESREPAPDPGRLGDGAPVWIGLIAAAVGGAARVSGVLDGSPAQRAGLAPGDDVVAVDGLRVTSDGELRTRLAARPAGTAVTLSLFRRGRLQTVGVELAAAPPTRYELLAQATATEAQRAAYQAWLGEPFPAPGPTGAPASLASVATGGRWL